MYIVLHDQRAYTYFLGLSSDSVKGGKVPKSVSLPSEVEHLSTKNPNLLVVGLLHLVDRLLHVSGAVKLACISGIIHPGRKSQMGVFIN